MTSKKMQNLEKVIAFARENGFPRAGENHWVDGEPVADIRDGIAEDAVTTLHMGITLGAQIHAFEVWPEGPYGCVEKIYDTREEADAALEKAMEDQE